MELKVIGTGSLGNAYILGHGNDMLLLDAGVSKDKILKAIGFDTAKIDCALVSHGHSDHFKSAEYLLNCFVNVMMPKDCADNLKVTTFRPNLFIADGTQRTFGNWIVKSFNVDHDVQTVGYLVYHTQTKQKILYATDMGFLRSIPKDINIMITECNYNNDLLHVPEMEERFVRVKTTHMSLERLVSYLDKIDLSMLTHIVVIHLSDTNSNEQVIVKTLQDKTGVNVTATSNGMNINLDSVPF